MEKKETFVKRVWCQAVSKMKQDYPVWGQP